MTSLFPLVSVLLLMQVAAEQAPRAPRESVQAVFDRASRAPDLDAAAVVLSSLLADDATLRSAYLSSAVLDERSVYILLGGAWGSRVTTTWADGLRRSRILVEAVSTRPALIGSIIRADRYSTYIRGGRPQGAATINYFTFFEKSRYADDLMEKSIESLRGETTHPAKAIESPYNELRPKAMLPLILVTAEDVEVNLLHSWQLICGVCDRLDLIDKATTKNWRDRFPELDRWFQVNRPYILWDDGKSCIRVDEEAKETGRATPRESRSIPALRPPWLPRAR